MPSSTSSVSELKHDLSGIREELLARKGQQDMLKKRYHQIDAEIADLLSQQEQYDLLIAFLSQMADERQERVYQQIEHTVTEGLRAVFDEDMRLEITTKQVGARSETHFNVVSYLNGKELSTSIMDARGGGVAALVGFLIQAVLVLLTPGMRPIIFLDEAFRNVSSDYLDSLGEFIRGLCEETGLQVVLVTHQPTLAEYADTHYEFSQRDGVTKIKKVV